MLHKRNNLILPAVTKRKVGELILPYIVHPYKLLYMPAEQYIMHKRC